MRRGRRRDQVRLSRVGMAARVASVIVVGILALAGIADLVVPAPAHRCADLVARALTSPRVTVRGAYDCFTPLERARVSASGFGGDEGLHKLAAGQRHEHLAYLGSSADGAVLYEFGGPAANLIVVLYTDPDGRVNRIADDPVVPGP